MDLIFYIIFITLTGDSVSKQMIDWFIQWIQEKESEPRDEEDDYIPITSYKYEDEEEEY